MSVRDDFRFGAAAATLGLAWTALLEYGITIASAEGPLRAATLLRFLALECTLVGLLAVVFVPLFALGHTALGRVTRAESDTSDLPSPLVIWLWAGGFFILCYLGASYGMTVLFLRKFKEPQLIAASLAGLQVLVIGLLVGLTQLLAAGLRRAAQSMHSLLGAWNPLGRALPAFLLLALVLAVPVAFVLRRLPQIRQVAPWRDILFVAIFLAAALLSRGRRLPRPAWFVAAYFVLATITLWKVGADPETKSLSLTASPTLSHLIDLVRRANDFDRDGYGSLLGENDCAPFDFRIHPNAPDLPDNGIDENCSGRDFSAKGLPVYKKGERAPVPPEYQHDWNILLVTVDTVRYDHTTFGGYKAQKGRDTTPELAKLASRGVSFRFANAPSAGTMASVPAILTSRFFHSGIALSGEREHGTPPKVLEQNTTLPEVMKRGGYRTGAILSHEYFTDWGLDQGVDNYDNSLGATANPFRITSAQVTDKAEQWISRQGNAKWFLWCHYIDPHGRYVAHPGEVQFGSSEEDLYDGELAFTDKHLGRLFDFLSRSQVGGRTIIVLTSDHGDGFMEHGFINHGQALYRELLHVPLLVSIPDVEPHTVDGPVSPLDIFPTLADLAGIDISDLVVEGESLIPQLFYARDAKDRVIFSETNWPDPLRAAVTNDYKLIYNLKANLYQLFDLHADAWEKKNLWGKDQKASDEMKALLDDWLERVYYSRDSGSQAQQVRGKVLLSEPPQPQHPVQATAGAAVEILGWDLDSAKLKAGDDLKVTVYFHSVAQAASAYKLALVAEAADARGTPPTVRQEKIPLDGTFPVNRWRPGDYVKESFVLRLPAGWQDKTLMLGVELVDDKRQAAVVTGHDASATRALLGEIAL